MSKHSTVQGVEEQHMKRQVTDFRIGDTVSVSLRIIEDGGKERLQVFTGTVIARTGTGLTETFSVHRVAYGEGMERVFFLHSPLISGIEVIRRGQVRRSKLYYLRGTSGKASKVKGRFMKEKKNKPAASQEAVETAANASA
ncbi:MAG: 50S ribosomal protein L19 [Verrucomicrobia bacterium]|nr:50S ribosomal protein L19 [Verrucomicrobiota bacterium]